MGSPQISPHTVWHGKAAPRWHTRCLGVTPGHCHQIVPPRRQGRGVNPVPSLKSKGYRHRAEGSPPQPKGRCSMSGMQSPFVAVLALWTKMGFQRIKIRADNTNLHRPRLEASFCIPAAELAKAGVFQLSFSVLTVAAFPEVEETQ